MGRFTLPICIIRQDLKDADFVDPRSVISTNGCTELDAT